MTETGTQTDLHPAALAVANWWADKAGVVTGNGDTGPSGGFTVALAVVAGAQGQTLAPSKRDAFVTALARRVTDSLERQRGRSTYQPEVCIGVDYGPDPLLADAARAAGVPTGVFPWKTMSWTRLTHVTASLGYGAQSRLVWAAEDWDRPACGAAKYGPAPEHERLPWQCALPIHHDEAEHDFSVPQPLCGAMVQDYSGGLKECNRPAGGDAHEVVDGWASPRMHEFVEATP